jgi:hypothetical protein
MSATGRIIEVCVIGLIGVSVIGRIMDSRAVRRIGVSVTGCAVIYSFVNRQRKGYNIYNKLKVR